MQTIRLTNLKHLDPAEVDTQMSSAQIAHLSEMSTYYQICRVIGYKVIVSFMDRDSVALNETTNTLQHNYPLTFFLSVDNASGAKDRLENYRIDNASRTRFKQFVPQMAGARARMHTLSVKGKPGRRDIPKDQGVQSLTYFFNQRWSGADTQSVAPLADLFLHVGMETSALANPGIFYGTVQWEAICKWSDPKVQVHASV